MRSLVIEVELSIVCTKGIRTPESRRQIVLFNTTISHRSTIRRRTILTTSFGYSVYYLTGFQQWRFETIGVDLIYKYHWYKSSKNLYPNSYSRPTEIIHRFVSKVFLHNLLFWNLVKTFNATRFGSGRGRSKPDFETVIKFFYNVEIYVSLVL